jgi:hypothetical protein
MQLWITEVIIVCYLFLYIIMNTSACPIHIIYEWMFCLFVEIFIYIIQLIVMNNFWIH